MLSLSDSVYLLAQPLGTYGIYRIMRDFLGGSVHGRKLTFAIFVIFDIAISLLHIVFNIPLLTMTGNLIGYFALTFLFPVSIKKRITATFSIYSALICIDVLITLSSGFLHLPLISNANYESVFGVILSNIIYLSISLIISRFRNIKNGDFTSGPYWFSY